MREDLDTRYRRILAKHFVMNEETWSELQTHGVTESSEPRLDFTYSAPDRQSAQSLKGVLEEETDYVVKVKSLGSPFGKHWCAAGSMQATAISGVVLDQWVDWMVTARLRESCEFDGWGTSV